MLTKKVQNWSFNISYYVNNDSVDIQLKKNFIYLIMFYQKEHKYFSKSFFYYNIRKNIN